MVRNLDDYPFPSDAPVPYAEAVFERASVEIARGCTEGCRFCQAGMIYRPVRERSPASIAKSLLDGVDKAGYDETGLTCLSTADFRASRRSSRASPRSCASAAFRCYARNKLRERFSINRTKDVADAPSSLWRSAPMTSGSPGCAVRSA